MAGRESSANDAIELRNLDQLVALSKALKEYDKELRKELHRSIRAAARPLIPVARDTLADFPSRGGLATSLRGTRIRAALKTGNDPGVSIIASGVTVRLAERLGIIRHPVFPKAGTPRREQTWVRQSVPERKGAIERAVVSNRDLALPSITAAVERVSQQVINRARGG